MKIKPFKSYLPRSLYGRAALILLLPIIGLQLLVSLVFIQRHFEDVTFSMTRSVIMELSLVLDSPEGQREALAEALSITLTQVPEALAEDQRALIDLQGRAIIKTLHEGLDGLIAVDTSDGRTVRIWAERDGIYLLEFRRSRVSASNPHQLLVIMVVMGAVLTLVAYIFLRNQLRPISRLSNAATEYGKGRLVPYNPGGATEVRAAGAAFLEMRNRIERQNQSRTMMLSGISHDLRTPLTRLRLEMSFLDDDVAAPMIRDVSDMEKLIDAFLDYGRAEAGVAANPVKPVALVRQVVEDAKRMGQNVDLVLPDGIADETVRLREQSVKRALENLIGNALRYGGTKVLLTLALTDRVCRISVEDDGPGIPSDKREEAMKPFTRLDSARNQNKGSGVGLGLAIVADIARLHGGSVRLTESEALGGLRVDVVLAR